MNVKQRDVVIDQIEEQIEENAKKIEIVSILFSKWCLKKYFCGLVCNKSGNFEQISGFKDDIYSLHKGKYGFVLQVTVNEAKAVKNLEKIRNSIGKVYIS